MPSDRVAGGVEHSRAVCPECDERSVTVMVAPLRPEKMACKRCSWDSLTRADSPTNQQT